jgi:hypothetical protein
MTIDAKGWIDFALDSWGPDHKVNSGVNPVKGVVFHSAEGWEPHITNLLMNGPSSWHGTVTLDGTLSQHYSLLKRCWHATEFNQEYVGFEFEGVAGTPLNAAQIATAQRIIADLTTWKGYAGAVRLPNPPSSAPKDKLLLAEHNEVVWIGGSPTACPSGRIPWDTIMGQAPAPPTQTGGGLAIIVIPSGGSYLVVGTYTALIPPQYLPDVTAMVYGDGPQHISQQAWEWLHTKPDKGPGFTRVS